MRWIIVFLVFIGRVEALNGDISYSSTDGIVQVAGQGKHWFGESFCIDGRYNKVEGNASRFSYGILSHHVHRKIVTELVGRIYDTHRSIETSSGVGGKYITVAAGTSREWPDAGIPKTFGSGTIRLNNLTWHTSNGYGLTIEGKYTYLNNGKNDRHDYKLESRWSAQHTYFGMRYEHIREIVVQGIFVGIKW
jgi:hypothetical protein